MTLTDAINILKNEKPHCGRKIRYTEGDICEAFDMAIKALEQEPCDDCVRRREVLDVLKDKWNMFSDADDAMQESINAIKALKSVTPQQMTGYWIDGVCSECGYIGDEEVFGGKFKYCPVCGTVMRGEE